MQTRTLHLLVTLTWTALASLAGAQSDGPLMTRLQFSSSDPIYFHTQYGNGPTLTDARTSAWSSASSFTSFGLSHLVYSGHGDYSGGHENGATGGAQAWWKHDITINAADPSLNGTSAVVRTVYHVTGSLTWNIPSDGGLMYMFYGVTIDDGFGYTVGYDTGGNHNAPLSSINTFTYDSSFQFGVPFQRKVYHSLSGQFFDSSSPSPRSGAGDVTLTADAMQVLDGNGNPIDYTMQSSRGSGRGSNIPAGGSFAGFSLTNDTANGHVGTTLTLLGGAASTNTNVCTAFSARPETAVLPAASDVATLTGTGSDPVVIQMSYDRALAQSLGLTESSLRLGYLNLTTGKWINAAGGNSGGQPQFFARAYNPATDFHVGYFGVDTTNHVVWAVVNHNSEFVVASLPDPLTLVSAVSRKSHNGLGPFDINLPLTGNVGVECRRSTASNDHEIVLTFSGPVTSIGSINLSATKGGTVSNTTINGATVTVDLTGVANEQIISLDLLEATNGTEKTSGSVSIGVLLGDANGDGTVNSADATMVRNRSGQDTSGTNFRADVNADGGVNSADATILRARSGTTIKDPVSLTNATQRLKSE